MRRVRITLLGVGLLFGTLLALAGSSLSGAAALPAAGCYPSCSTTTVSNPTTTLPATTTTLPGPTTTAPAVVAHTSSGNGDPSADPSTATQATGSLAFTGSDIVGMVVIALLLVGGGIVLVGVSRRRSSLSD